MEPNPHKSSWHYPKARIGDSLGEGIGHMGIGLGIAQGDRVGDVGKWGRVSTKPWNAAALLVTCSVCARSLPAQSPLSARSVPAQCPL